LDLQLIKQKSRGTTATRVWVPNGGEQKATEHYEKHTRGEDFDQLEIKEALNSV
jgi:hypothetical protein